MEWQELRTRLSQEFSKRADLLRYRLGLEPRTGRIQPREAANASFFFPTGKHETAHLASLLRSHLPDEAEAILQEADNICRHQFHLLGFGKIDYGANIDWHSDAVHGKRSPLAPWFKLSFLDFATVGDHKIIWELNRHQHLVTLAKAALLSANSAYVTEITMQLDSWRNANPHPLGINWASSLEVAFRSLSWIWVDRLLAGFPELPANFHTDLLLALQTNGRYIERYLSTYFSPNTHLIGEAVALFFIGTLCPEIPAGQRWQAKGWTIILQESQRQVRPDGVYFEQSLYYHVYALDFFLHARILASKNGVAIPEQFDNVLRKMLDVVQRLSEAGAPEGFGDDDGGRLFNPQRNRVECMRDPLALGAILYDPDRYPSSRLTEEALWIFGDKALQVLDTQDTPTTASSNSFPDGGIFLMNDDAPNRQQLMIDAGPQGTGNSGHGHADALSIHFSLDRERFLIDPGTYCYISAGDERNQFRGTSAHNTLRIDSLDQAVPDGPFAWLSIPNVEAETWLNGETFDFFVGSHDGYRRLPQPVLHRRFVFHVKGGLWLIRDVVEGEGDHLLETFWHFAPGIEVKREGETIFAESSTHSTKPPTRMALLMDPASMWTSELTEGLVAPAYGLKQAAPVLRISAKAPQAKDCGVLLLPITDSANVGAFSALGGEESDARVRGYRYTTLQAAEIIFFATGNSSWTCGSWRSDANLLFCKLEGGRLQHVIMVSGSFGEWRGKRFVSNPSRSQIFEWTSAARSKSDSSAGVDDSVIKDFAVFDPVS
ncbi:MAG: putative Heparinase family protein [Candidatus Sulfotelmatobacter sp.]|nr:putative Heparinase family protein [Candidatus Sulfotelmatobacter sp.]